jgi:predicted HicB family RNase H-like nuclease
MTTTPPTRTPDGRWAAAEPRDKVIALRVTVEEHNRLVAAAFAAGVTLSEWLRARGLS